MYQMPRASHASFAAIGLDQAHERHLARIADAASLGISSQSWMLLHVRMCMMLSAMAYEMA